jgi:hypothetical protein
MGETHWRKGCIPSYTPKINAVDREIGEETIISYSMVS